MSNTAKQEAIRKAWLKHGIPYNDKIIDDEGFLLADNKEDVPEFITKFYMETKYRYDRKSFQFSLRGFRPIELQNISTNNGWIRIESEDDLPKEYGYYFVVDLIGDGVSVVSFNPDNKASWIDLVTHFQPIVKPEKPIY